MPAVRRPNCAGSAPVISAMLPAKLVSRTWPKPEMPSGNVMPLMRYCTLACSLRTWMSPLTALSCETPGACSNTELIGASVPCGRVSMKARFMSKRAGAEPRRQIIARNVELRVLVGESRIAVELRRRGGSGARWRRTLRLHDDFWECDLCASKARPRAQQHKWQRRPKRNPINTR